MWMGGVPLSFDPAGSGGAANLSGQIQIEPNRWQLITVPTLYGHWITGSTPLFQDTFTDVDGVFLEAGGHLPNIGAGWIKPSYASWRCSVLSNRAIGIEATGGVQQHFAYTEVIGPDFIIQANLTGVTNIAFGIITEFVLRGHASNSQLSTRVQFNYNQTGNCRITYLDNQWMNLGQTDVAWSPEQTKPIKIVVDGTDVEVFVDDISVLTINDPNIGSAGPLGLSMSGRLGYQYWKVDDYKVLPLVTGLVNDGNPATIKNYVVDQLEDKYGAGVVEVCNAYFGDDNSFRTYIPGVTPENDPANFPLAYYDSELGGYEFAAFWLKSAHPSAMILDWETYATAP